MEKVTNWFEALGKNVTDAQRDRVIEEAREMGLEIEDNSPWVNKIARYVEQDCPQEAIDETREKLDVTGSFRFLAVLCAQKPRECEQCGEGMTQPSITEHRGKQDDLEFCSSACHFDWRYEYSVELLKGGYV